MGQHKTNRMQNKRNLAIVFRLPFLTIPEAPRFHAA
jgi:hypothetical protein